MLSTLNQESSVEYAKCIENSKRINWDIDKDVIRGRKFSLSEKFLPDGLTQITNFKLLSDDEKKLVSQIQGRTYAYLFGLVERFINTKILEISRDYAFGDQLALESLTRFSQEELKHQEMFRRIEEMIDAEMPHGYVRAADPNDVARAVLSKSTWAVLALTCHIELFTLAHYRQSILPDDHLSELFKDVFLHHWQEETQHAALDELEWKKENARLTNADRDTAVDEFIDLVAAVDALLQAQSKADADYFLKLSPGKSSAVDTSSIQAGFLKAYRWQYILSGIQMTSFQEILGDMINEVQMKRIQRALATLM